MVLDAAYIPAEAGTKVFIDAFEHYIKQVDNF